MTNNKQRSLGVVLQYVQMSLGILIQLAYTPIMLRILGKNEYGIYNLASSIIAYLSLLSLGFGSSYIRFFSRYKNEKKESDIRRLNGLYLIVFFAIGILALISGLLLSNHVELFYNNTYSIKDLETARILLIILSINLAISFPASVFVSYITAQEKFVFQKILNMGKTILSPALSIVLLYLGFGSIGLVLSTTVISVVVDCLNVFYCFAKLKMKVSFKNPDFALFKDIFVFSIYIAINQVIDQINWQTDKIILGKVCSGASVAIYAIGAQINTMFTSFSTAISSVFAPKVNRIVAKSDEGMNNELTAIFIKVGRIQWFILFLILSGFIFFGQYFVYRWAGSDYANSYWVALLLMCPAIIPLIQNIGIEIQRAENKHKFRSLVYLIMALLNVTMSILLAMRFGEIGTAIGTTISLIVANGVIMNVYYQKKLCINIVEFWKSIGQTLLGMIIPITAGICMTVFYKFNSLFDFSLLAVAYSLIYFISIYFFSFNEEEKQTINTVFKKVFRI